MDQADFLSEMERASGMEHNAVKRADFWVGYRRGMMRGYFGEKFGTEEEHMDWWIMADIENDVSSQERGRGYRAGLRRATKTRHYCTRSNFSCERCSLVISGRDCRQNLIIQMWEG